jgi:hypothetical protein
MSVELKNGKFMTAEKILSESQLATLSPKARRLFASAWNRLKHRNLNAIWIKDLEACNRSRIQFDDFARIQNELDQSNLLRVSPGLIQSKYEFVENETE